MSKDTKIVLIVLGSIAGFFVLAIVLAFVLFGVFVSRGMASDDAGKAKAAAKIATFALPPGYKYLTAMDLTMIDTVVIVNGIRPRDGFEMELQGMSLRPETHDTDSVLQAMKNKLNSTQECANPRETGIESLPTASHAKVDLHVLECANGKLLELGTIPSHFPLAVLVAVGATDSFDHAALRRLVGSIRL